LSSPSWEPDGVSLKPLNIHKFQFSPEKNKNIFNLLSKDLSVSLDANEIRFNTLANPIRSLNPMALNISGI
jgi:hypothetical protein